MTQYAYSSTRTLLNVCVITLKINYQRSNLRYRRKIHFTMFFMFLEYCMQIHSVVFALSRQINKQKVKMYAKTINRIFVTYHLKGGVNPNPPPLHTLLRRRIETMFCQHIPFAPISNHCLARTSGQSTNVHISPNSQTLLSHKFAGTITVKTSSPRQ